MWLPSNFGAAAPDIRPLNYVRPGQPSPSGSATWLNQLIAVANCIALARHGTGIRITKSAGGMVIELDDETKKKLEEITPGGGGSISFRGEYNTGTAYLEGDVVIAWSKAHQTAGTAGTFICLADNTGQPLPVGEAYDTAYWATLSRGHWDRIEVRDHNTETQGATTINGGRVRLQVGASGPYVAMDDTYAGYDADLDGKVFTLRIVDVCEDGVNKKMGILATEPWVP